MTAMVEQGLPREVLFDVCIRTSLFGSSSQSRLVTIDRDEEWDNIIHSIYKTSLHKFLSELPTKLALVWSSKDAATFTEEDVAAFWERVKEVEAHSKCPRPKIVILVSPGMTEKEKNKDQKKSRNVRV